MKPAKGACAALALLAAAAGVWVFCFVFQYPRLPETPAPGKWYRLQSPGMKTSQGEPYRAFFKQGTENKVMVYFAGGGVSVNEETARGGAYTTGEAFLDALANRAMNMGGLASQGEASSFAQWSFVLFPYATGDFHAGAGVFPYTDVDGEEKLLYHNGYENFTAAMELVAGLPGLQEPEAVVVTGYSAGGFAAALLADDLFSRYFPEAPSKTVLVDSALLEYQGWQTVAREVWGAPRSIWEKLTTGNMTLDCLESLREKYGEGVRLLFTSSTRDGDLAKLQNYLDTGAMEATRQAGDRYQRLLRESLPRFQAAGVKVFLWDGVPWYDGAHGLTAHTSSATPAVWEPREGAGQSVAGWLAQAVEGPVEDWGVELAYKPYEGGPGG